MGHHNEVFWMPLVVLLGFVIIAFQNSGIVESQPTDDILERFLDSGIKNLDDEEWRLLLQLVQPTDWSSAPSEAPTVDAVQWDETFEAAVYNSFLAAKGIEAVIRARRENYLKSPISCATRIVQMTVQSGELSPESMLCSYLTSFHEDIVKRVQWVGYVQEKLLQAGKTNNTKGLLQISGEIVRGLDFLLLKTNDLITEQVFGAKYYTSKKQRRVCQSLTTSSLLRGDVSVPEVLELLPISCEEKQDSGKALPMGSTISIGIIEHLEILEPLIPCLRKFPKFLDEMEEMSNQIKSVQETRTNQLPSIRSKSSNLVAMDPNDLMNLIGPAHWNIYTAYSALTQQNAGAAMTSLFVGWVLERNYVLPCDEAFPLDMLNYEYERAKLNFWLRVEKDINRLTAGFQIRDGSTFAIAANKIRDATLQMDQELTRRWHEGKMSPFSVQQIERWILSYDPNFKIASGRPQDSAPSNTAPATGLKPRRRRPRQHKETIKTVVTRQRRGLFTRYARNHEYMPEEGSASFVPDVEDIVEQTIAPMDVDVENVAAGMNGEGDEDAVIKEETKQSRQGRGRRSSASTSNVISTERPKAVQPAPSSSSVCELDLRPNMKFQLRSKDPRGPLDRPLSHDKMEVLCQIFGKRRGGTNLKWNQVATLLEAFDRESAGCQQRTGGSKVKCSLGSFDESWVFVHRPHGKDGQTLDTMVYDGKHYFVHLWNIGPDYFRVLTDH